MTPDKDRQAASRRRKEEAMTREDALREALQNVVDTWPKDDSDYYKPDHDWAIQDARKLLALLREQQA